MDWCKKILKPSVPSFKIEARLGVNNFLIIRNKFFCRIRENYRYELQRCVTKNKIIDSTMESNNIHPYWFLKLSFCPNLIIYLFLFQHKNEIIASLFKDIFEFTWKAECDKVKRVVVTQDYYCGGLKMDNIDNFIKSSKCSWIKK